MLAEERFSQILALLAEKRTATVQELCEALNVSESTIRRDLLELDRQGRVNKVHGGATLPSSQFRADEPTMEAKETLAVRMAWRPLVAGTVPLSVIRSCSSLWSAALSVGLSFGRDLVFFEVGSIASSPLSGLVCTERRVDMRKKKAQDTYESA